MAAAGALWPFGNGHAGGGVLARAVPFRVTSFSAAGLATLRLTMQGQPQRAPDGVASPWPGHSRTQARSVCPLSRSSDRQFLVGVTGFEAGRLFVLKPKLGADM